MSDPTTPRPDAPPTADAPTRPPRVRRGTTISRWFVAMPSQIPDVPHNPTAGWLARLSKHRSWWP